MLPGTAEVAPSVLVTARSRLGRQGVGVGGGVVAGLVVGRPGGRAAVAVLLIVPVAFGSIVPVSVMLTLSPLARLSPLIPR